MNISFEQLKSMVVFAQIVEQGSFSAAAKHLGLARASVSYHLKKLEAATGVQLLNRSTRSIALTEAGETYYQRCKVIAEQAATANSQMENLKNEPEGLLKITCPVNAGMQTIVPALSEFKRLYPKIELDVMLTDEVVNILKEGIDLAIRGAPLPDSSLKATQLCVLPTCLVGAPSYFEKYGTPIHPTDLAQHQWVIYKMAASSLTITKGSRSFSINPKGTVNTNNAAARTAFVEGGHGLGRIPLYDAQPKINAGKLIPILKDYSMQDITVYGVFPPGGTNAKKLRLLIDFLKKHKRD
jgi:LysR family transcriptional regulator, transcriptional activator for aaeXAB operon